MVDEEFITNVNKGFQINENNEIIDQKVDNEW